MSVLAQGPVDPVSEVCVFSNRDLPLASGEQPRTIVAVRNVLHSPSHQLHKRGFFIPSVEVFFDGLWLLGETPSV